MPYFNLSTYSVVHSGLVHKPIPYEDSKHIGLSTINALLRLVYQLIDPLCFAHKPIPYEDIKRIYQSSINALL